MFKKISFVFTLLLSLLGFGQNIDGYWDNVRITSETLTLKAGEKKIIKTADFPQGTTEVVFRITVLDENQKLVNSLSSLLKSIPDPTGISQGSAGAIYLLSAVTGTDKCKYAVFSSNDNAQAYLKNDKINSACLVQNVPVNKDAKVISFTGSKCFSDDTHSLWFGFESDNWVMKQKILIEVVPWVDKKAVSGWTNDNKKSLINACKTLETARQLKNADNFCACILDKVRQQYSFKDYNNLLLVEKNNSLKKQITPCLKETGEYSIIENQLRVKADSLAQSGQYDEAIQLIKNQFLLPKKGTALDYNAVGRYYLLSKQYEKSVKFLKEGEKLDNSELKLQLNLAHAYLLNNEVGEAKEIHRKYKSQNISAKVSWVQQTELDFKLFEKLGLPDDDFKKILRILK